MSDLCPCGRPLHYSNPETQAYVQWQIAELGPTIPIVTPHGAWLVPRHYIALHGIKAVELPQLAARYGWLKGDAGATENRP